MDEKIHQKKDNMVSVVGLLLCGFLSLNLSSCVRSGVDSVDKKDKRAVAANESDPRLRIDEPDYHRAALANVELGLGYLEQGEIARAKMKLVHAIKLSPNIPETHLAFAHFLEMTGAFKDSEQEYKKSIRFARGKEGSVYNNYGAFLCRQERFKEADKAFLRAIEDKEYARTAEVYENAGLCALKWSSDPEQKAKQYLNISVRSDPQRFSALLGLVELELKNKDFLAAEELLDRYKKMAMPSARSTWLGIQVYKGLKNDAAVARDALTLKSLFEDSPEYGAYLKSEKSSHSDPMLISEPKRPKDE